MAKLLPNCWRVKLSKETPVPVWPAVASPARSLPPVPFAAAAASIRALPSPGITAINFVSALNLRARESPCANTGCSRSGWDNSREEHPFLPCRGTRAPWGRPCPAAGAGPQLPARPRPRPRPRGAVPAAAAPLAGGRGSVRGAALAARPQGRPGCRHRTPARGSPLPPPLTRRGAPLTRCFCSALPTEEIAVVPVLS